MGGAPLPSFTAPQTPIVFLSAVRSGVFLCASLPWWTVAALALGPRSPLFIPARGSLGACVSSGPSELAVRDGTAKTGGDFLSQDRSPPKGPGKPWAHLKLIRTQSVVHGCACLCVCVAPG